MHTRKKKVSPASGRQLPYHTWKVGEEGGRGGGKRERKREKREKGKKERKKEVRIKQIPLSCPNDKFHSGLEMVELEDFRELAGKNKKGKKEKKEGIGIHLPTDPPQPRLIPLLHFRYYAPAPPDCNGCIIME